MQALTQLDRISLIIVTWNGDDVLKACLDSIVRVYGALPETLIVDNANQASTAKLVSGYANARLIALPENRGFAGGNTAALPFCTKDYLILLNNDTVLTGDAISPLIDFLESHPAAAAAQGKLLLGQGPRLDGCGAFLSPLGILSFRGAFVPDAPEFNHPERVFAISGAFFAIRRNALVACGGFFYDHFQSYYEEIDLYHRLARAGFECWYVPTPPVWHIHSATSNKFKRETILRQYYRNIWFSFLTCFDAFARIHYCTLLFMLSLGQSIAGLLRGNATALRAHLSVGRQIFAERKLIRETRQKLRALRKRSDREILSFAVRHQPLSYYWSLLRK